MVMCSVCLLCTSMVSGLSSCAISAGGPSVASTSTLYSTGIYTGGGRGEGGRDRGRGGEKECTGGPSVVQCGLSLSRLLPSSYVLLSLSPSSSPPSPSLPSHFSTPFSLQLLSHSPSLRSPAENLSTQAVP